MNAINAKKENAFGKQLLRKISAYIWQGLGEILFLKAN